MLKISFILVFIMARSQGLAAQAMGNSPAADETCASIAFPNSNGSEIPPSAQLTPSASKVRVEVHFTSQFNGSSSQLLTDSENSQRQNVCAAAKYFGTVWSSKEFQDRVTQSDDFIRGARFLIFGHKRISGADLIAILTAKPVIVMNISGSTLGNPVKNCALSPGKGNETLLREEYLNGKPKPDCGSPIVVALTNTLSHEYTHYSRTLGSVGSTDKGFGAANNLRYVSYGIGCITQTIAFPSTKCSDRSMR